VHATIIPSAMDIVCIEDLRVDTVIGVYAWERELRQPLLIGARLGYDNRSVATLGTTIDYASVVRALREHVGSRTDELLETLAESCCALLAERFHPRSIELRIDKPLAAAALGCARVGVRLHRDYA
jgi:dihydroneopterin aldolase